MQCERYFQMELKFLYARGDHLLLDSLQKLQETCLTGLLNEDQSSEAGSCPPGFETCPPGFEFVRSPHFETSQDAKGSPPCKVSLWQSPSQSQHRASVGSIHSLTTVSIVNIIKKIYKSKQRILHILMDDSLVLMDSTS